MKLIKPYTEIWEQAPGMEGMLRHIERCARVCYKSEDKIGEGTAEKMFEMLKDRGHTAMLEHGTVYLTIPREDKLTWQEYTGSIWCAVDFDHERVYVTTNYRYMYENGLLNDLTFQTEPFIGHKRRITVHFVCDRGISHELVRHRVFSFAQESTRYCNYSKNKFNNEITYILPPWVDMRQLGNHNSKELLIQMGNLNSPSYSQDDLRELYFLFGLASSEIQYFDLINNGWTPQQARSVLPNSLKTEVCMTGFESDWDHFFELRCAQAAHPQMRELAIPLQETFKTL